MMDVVVTTICFNHSFSQHTTQPSLTRALVKGLLVMVGMVMDVAVTIIQPSDFP